MILHHSAARLGLAILVYVGLVCVPPFARAEPDQTEPRPIPPAPAPPPPAQPLPPAPIPGPLPQPIPPAPAPSPRTVEP
ncbi:MAG TPA: hypothetical protein VJ805_11090 [Nitrospiraceae bacterium]|nr:hypothetical protein [Nitrospiraceae bacterium]